MRANTFIALMAFISFVLGIGATLIAQYVNKHVSISASFDHYHR